MMADDKTLTFPPLTLEELAKMYSTVQKKERELRSIVKARKDHPELAEMLENAGAEFRDASLKFHEMSRMYRTILELKYASAPETITSNPADFLVLASGVVVENFFEHPEYLERLRTFLGLFPNDVIGKSLTILHAESVDGQLSPYSNPSAYEVARLEKVPVVKLSVNNQLIVYLDVGKHTYKCGRGGPFDALTDKIEIDLGSIIGKEPSSGERRYHIRIRVDGKEIYRNPLDVKDGTRFAELDGEEGSASPSGSNAHATNIVPGNP